MQESILKAGFGVQKSRRAEEQEGRRTGGQEGRRAWEQGSRGAGEQERYKVGTWAASSTVHG